MNSSQSVASDNTRRSFVPDLESARTVLGFLAGLQSAPEVVADDNFDPDRLAAWLANNSLGSLGQVSFRSVYPEVAARLQPEMFATVAQNALHWRNLQQIDAQLAHIGIPSVLLKGAALAGTVYERLELRSMTDVDLWFRERDIGQACHVMTEQGFVNFEKSSRPLALQTLSEGEIQYFSDDQPPTLVELHLSPFPGWWLQRTAAIDKQAVWSRKEALGDWVSFYQLAAEDAVIHTAVHLAVNHQFGPATLRSLMDVALIARVRTVAWQIVAARAKEWRVATAVWLALYLVQQLIGTPGLEEVLSHLQPAAWRRRQLQRFVSPESVLAEKHIKTGRERYQFLVVLVDRPQDAGRLIYRTLWPEDEWLNARYGGSVDHWQHIRQLIIQGDV